MTVDLHAAMPFTALLGATAVAVAPGEVRLRLDWAENRCTAGGLLHGGALMGLADAGGGLCAYLNLPEGATGTATSRNVSLTAGVLRYEKCQTKDFSTNLISIILFVFTLIIVKRYCKTGRWVLR